MSVNKVILVGNLTRDPEVRNLPSGMAVCDMRLAVSESYKNKSGERVESVCYVDVVAWARQAENCGEYLSKGSPVMIEGSLRMDEWTTKDNEKRSKLLVNAARVQFLGGGRSGDGRDGGARAPSDSPPRRSAPPHEPVGDDFPSSDTRDVPPGGEADEDNLPF